MSIDTRYVRGLPNFGATCYLNSWLQALFANDTLQENILSSTIEKPFHASLKCIFKYLKDREEKKKDGEENKKDLEEKKKDGEENKKDGEENNWESYLNKIWTAYANEHDRGQQDTLEFGRWLLNNLDEEDNHITNLYGGYCSSTVELSCPDKCILETEQKFFDIVLTLPSERKINISTLIKNFCSEDILDKFTCNKCNKDGEAKTRIAIKKFPENLILAVDRAYFDQSTNTVEKNNILVEIEKSLTIIDKLKKKETLMENNEEISSILADEIVYDLFAIIEHYGSTLKSGHYVCMLTKNDIWCKVNDSSSSDCNQYKFSNAVYVLFYKKRSVKTISINSSDAPSFKEKAKKFCHYAQSIEILSSNKKYRLLRVA